MHCISPWTWDFFKETASSRKQYVHMWFLEVLIFKALGDQPAALRVALCKIGNIRILMKFCSSYLLWHFSLCDGDSGGSCEAKYTYLFHSKLEVSISTTNHFCVSLSRSHPGTNLFPVQCVFSGEVHIDFFYFNYQYTWVGLSAYNIRNRRNAVGNLCHINL